MRPIAVKQLGVFFVKKSPSVTFVLEKFSYSGTLGLDDETQILHEM
jgi:hypothetical protein